MKLFCQCGYFFFQAEDGIRDDFVAFDEGGLEISGVKCGKAAAHSES